MIAIAAFCAGFILSGLIAGWAGMWKRPPKECWSCWSRGEQTGAAQSAAQEDPAWYDFLRSYPVVGNVSGAWRWLWWVAAWPFRSGWWVAPAFFAFAAGIHWRATESDRLAVSTAQAWCAKHGCEVLDTGYDGGSRLMVHVRFPGQSVESRDCRGSECSKP